MSIRDQIAALEQLATVDVDIRRIEEELDKHRGGIEGMRSEVKTLDERLKGHRDSISEMEKTRGELHIELRQMVQQIERSREKLGRSRNERESNAAQRELEELRKLQRDREDEIERLNQLAEQARVSSEEATGKRTTISESLQGSSAGVAASIGELEEARAGRQAERTELVKKLPPILYRRYESIRTRRPYAVARTSDGTCNGCHISIPPMMFQKMLRQEEFEQCPNCRRILYYMPAASVAPEPGAETPRERSSRSPSR
ncbi:MAG: C4-type zinc ribbon domain-containing protein [Polyangiaceae bacterium]